MSYRQEGKKRTGERKTDEVIDQKKERKKETRNRKIFGSIHESTKGNWTGEIEKRYKNEETRLKMSHMVDVFERHERR